MKRIFYPAMFSLIVFAGLFVGMIKGKEVRHKWVAKMKNRQEEKRSVKSATQITEVALDDIEMATYHS